MAASYETPQAPWDGDPFLQDPSLEPIETPIWRESFAGLEWMALRSAPVYFGCGIPRGHGERVILVPGFLGTDLYLTEMFFWLARIGYRPHLSDIGRNIDCPNELSALLLQTVRRISRRSGERVSLIGHSLGGMMARSVATDHPDLVDRVITMGSPFQDVARANPVLIGVTRRLHEISSRHIARNVRPSCFSGHCTCNFVRNMLLPGALDFRRYAIYSRTDGVVDWRSCVEEDESLNSEVDATHTGMAFNPQVYRIIAERLAEGRGDVNIRAARPDTARRT